MKKQFMFPALRVISTDIITTDNIGIVNGSQPGSPNGNRAPGRVGGVPAPGAPAITDFD